MGWAGSGTGGIGADIVVGEVIEASHLVVAMGFGAVAQGGNQIFLGLCRVLEALHEGFVAAGIIPADKIVQPVPGGAWHGDEGETGRGEG